MVIRLVAHGDLLFLDLPPQLSVHPLSHRSGGRHRVLPENLTQMVEQAGGRQEHIGPARLVEVFQKEVGVFVSLFRRFIVRETSHPSWAARATSSSMLRPDAPAAP